MVKKKQQILYFELANGSFKNKFLEQASWIPITDRRFIWFNFRSQI